MPSNPFGNLNKDQQAIAIKVADAARLNNIDPELALAIAWQENHFRPAGTSSAGAIGPMQVMPFHADRFGVTKQELANPDTNIDVGMQILKESLDSYDGNPRAAIVGYNAGPNVAKEYMKAKEDFKTIPQETRNYLESVHKIRDLTKPGYMAEGPETEEEGPFGRTEALPSHLNETSSINMPEEKSTIWSDMKDNPELTGAGIGTASGILERLHKFGKEVPKVVAEETMRNAPNMSSGQKWASAIGGPGGETVSEAAKNYQLSKNLQGGETLTEKGIILPPGARERLDADLETRGQKISKALHEKIPFYGKGVEAGKYLTKGAAKLMAKAAPLSTAATGFGVGMNIDELAQRMHAGDTKGAVLAGVTGAANLATLIPGAGVARGIGTLAAIPLNVADFLYSPDEERSIVKDYMKKKEQNKAKGGSVSLEIAFPLSRKHVYHHRLKRALSKKKS